MTLRDWSVGRIVLVSVLWAFGVMVFTAWRTLTFMRGEAEESGLAGASVGLSDLLKLAAWVLLPPAALLLTWLVQRR